MTNNPPNTEKIVYRKDDNSDRNENNFFEVPQSQRKIPARRTFPATHVIDRLRR